MPREKQALEKITIRVRTADLEIIRKYHPQGGYNRVVRDLLRRYARALETRAAQLTKKEVTEDEINDFDLDI